MNQWSEIQLKKKLALLTVGALFGVAAAVPAGAAPAGGRATGANAAARNVEPVRGAAHQTPAAYATQEATLAVMQMAIQTATQTAIQSAVQTALQYAGTPAKPAATAPAAVPAAPAVPPPPPPPPPPAAPPTPPAPAKEAPPPLPTWEILPRDRSVRAALERWTASAGWQLSWELAVDYPVAARTSISGTFEAAVEAVAQSLERAEVPVKAVMYRGNRVLRIVAKGSE